MARTTSTRESWSTSGPTLQLALAPGAPRREAIESGLRAAIREGRLRAGTRLPSTRALAADLGVARGTVAEAYAQLLAEGHLEARRGSGTWVAEIAPAPARPRPRAPELARPRYVFHPGLPDLAAFPRAAWLRALRRALATVPASALEYGDPRGQLELREALAAYLGRARGAIADPELIVVCGGFRHGLSLLLRAVRASGGRRVALEDPCVDEHRAVATAADLEIAPVPADGDGARTDLLEASGAAAAVLGPAHQFPLGSVLAPARRAQAAAWARAGGLVIEDDYDGELRFDRHPVGALQALAPDHVAYGGTASKTLAPGLRLGWLLVPPALLEPVVALRRAEDIHVPVLDQIALGELLTSGAYERHIRRMRARYRARRDRLVALLAERAPGVRPVGISAGLRVLLELPPGGPPAAELVERAARHSVGLWPVSGYHHDPATAPEGVVVGYGALAEHDFDAALRALGDVLATAAAP
jgi:GntR family transcriptional regulator / MocR family aminotransferase